MLALETGLHFNEKVTEGRDREIEEGERKTLRNKMKVSE
jgi:hypothetical protein